jgi:hypothetical protein
VSRLLKSALGRVAARAVNVAAGVGGAPARPLSEAECAVAAPVFAGSLDLLRVKVRSPVRGVVGISRRAFVIEDAIFVPAAFLPLTPAVLVHELVHVWQHQHGGHGYIADSLQAQLWGEGYALARAAAERRPWHALNCEQQASLIEEAYSQGFFHGQPVRLGGIEATEWARRGVEELRAGRGSR